MSTNSTRAAYTLDEIIERLDAQRQRATYGAVAGFLNRPPRNLMAGRDRSPRASWIVSSQTGRPTGYEEAAMHAELESSERVLSSPAELRDWLASAEVAAQIEALDETSNDA